MAAVGQGLLHQAVHDAVEAFNKLPASMHQQLRDALSKQATWGPGPLPGLSQQQQCNARRLQLYSALMVVSGVLAPGAYQAMYAAPILTDDSAAVAGYDVSDYAFRMLNGVSFMLALMCILSCVVALMCLVYPPLCSDEPPSAADKARIQDCIVTDAAERIILQLYAAATTTFIGSLLVLLAACCVAAMRLMGPWTYGVGIVTFVIFAVSVCPCVCILVRYWQFKDLVGEP